MRVWKKVAGLAAERLYSEDECWSGVVRKVLLENEEVGLFLPKREIFKARLC